MATDTVCPKCGGTGFIVVESAHVSSAKRCDCGAKGRAGRMEDKAQIPPLYRNASFENFDWRRPDNPLAQKQLFDSLFLVKNFVKTFKDETRPGLLLIGDHGVGKTYLAVAALRAIIGRGYEGIFCDYQNLLDRIRAGYDPVSNSSDKEAYRIALDTEVLLLDDLGAHRGSDWVEDTITSIVTWRCNQRKALIATTNQPDGDAGSNVIRRNALGQPEYGRTLAEQIGPRARSRLFEMCTVVHMPLVEDYRLRKAKKF